MKKPIPVYRFALVVCRHPTTNDYLMVEEKDGWWLPGGGVEQEETFEHAAIRETFEEAGIDITLKGILRVEFTNHITYSRMRVIYFAVPTVMDQEPKNFEDKESLGAKWLNYKAIKTKILRGDEPLEWIRYLRHSGQVYPLSIFTREDEPME